VAPTYPSPSAGLWAKKGSLGSVTNPLVGLETHKRLCSELDPFSERSGRRCQPTVSLEDFLPPNSSRFSEARGTRIFVRLLGFFSDLVRRRRPIFSGSAFCRFPAVCHGVNFVPPGGHFHRERPSAVGSLNPPVQPDRAGPASYCHGRDGLSACPVGSTAVHQPPRTRGAHRFTQRGVGTQTNLRFP